jgi:alkaline phosphatase
LNGTPFRTDRGIAVLGLNSAGDPWFSWASGPHAAKAYGAAKLTAQQSPANESIVAEPPQEPAAFYAPSALETMEDVVVLGAGQGSEAFRGTLDNTAIFTVIRDSL